MAFRKKAAFITIHNPDILIIPECEHPDKLIFIGDVPTPTDIIWYGKNQNKGLAIFSYNNYRLKLLDDHEPEFKTVLPMEVTNDEETFTLFAIWANNPLDSDYQYIGQVWKSINYYNNLLSSNNVILMGDFNSNTIWDRPLREANHSTVVNLLAQKGIESVYHKFYNISQGKEEHSTLYMYRHENKPYHIDYCFASSHFMNKLKNVEIGSHLNWAAHSDHAPVIVTFE